jgi:tetratricopeptide (TPR) repeat protein
VERQPNDAELLVNIGYIWRRQGLFEQTIANFLQVLRVSPNNILVSTELAHTYEVMRDYAKSIRQCDQILALAPTNHWAYLIKAQCYWNWEGDLAKARATLEQNPGKNKTYSKWYWFLQEIYEGDYQAALDRILNLSDETMVMQGNIVPRSLAAGFAYALLQNSLRACVSFEDARVLLESEIEENPKDPRLHSALGLAWAGIGSKDDAIREGKRGVELYPVTKDALLGPHRIFDLAIIYAMVGESDAALDQLVHLLSIPSPYSMPLFQLDPRLKSLHDHQRFAYLREQHTGSE